MAKAMRCSCHSSVYDYLQDYQLDAIYDEMKKGKHCGPRTHTPESIMYSGGIIRPLTGGKADRTVEAIGFHDGKVLVVGTKYEVTAAMDNRASAGYTKVELSNGETILPGFIETHMHIVSSAIKNVGLNNFGPFDGQRLQADYNLEGLADKVALAKTNLETSPEDFWILGHGVDPALMPFIVADDDGLNELRSFDCDTVDKFEDEVPVFMLSASSHSAYVNTKALRLTYDADANLELREEYPKFCDYLKHVNDGGGLQAREGITPVFNAIPQKQIDDATSKVTESLHSVFQLARERGVTLLYDAGTTSSTKKILDAYFSKTFPTARVGYAQLCNNLAEVDAVPPYKPPTNSTYYQGSIKIVSDGSNQGLTGYQPEDTYRCKPEDNRGIFNFETDKFNDIVKAVAVKGWPLMIHANGITAIKKTLTAYEAALGSDSGLLKRHRIEHCSLPDASALTKMAALGISPSFLIGHVGYWGYAFDKGIFEENAQILDPCFSALSKGMRISLHTDHGVSPLGSLRAIEQAVTRIMEKDPEGRVLNDREKVTRAQALCAVTYDAAWQCHADQWVGSLEKGKMADYVKLAEDPITRKDPVGIRDIPVLETWLGGEKVFDIKQKLSA